ncbi:MAG: uracil-DNA glycosylase family protein [Chloroflexota bacterium]
MTHAERREALAEIAAEVRDCKRCRLSANRTRAVPGEGNASTEVVFVGEGPGEQEDRQGRPFVGASGTLLTELIGSVGWRREDVFITNVVKCRPPGNRDPQPDEIEACAPFLARQLAVLDPAVVVTVGKHSLQTFRPGHRIGQAHGSVAAADPATGARDAVVFSMYHPAFALYQASNKQTLVDDIARLPDALIDSRRRRTVTESREMTADSTMPDEDVITARDATATSDITAVPADMAADPAETPEPQLTLF